jgi:hypothetical protein
MSKKIFINRRRKGGERREDADPCKEMPIDIYHRKRRKAAERRKLRTLDEDYYAFLSTIKHELEDLTDSHFH